VNKPTKKLLEIVVSDIDMILDLNKKGAILNDTALYLIDSQIRVVNGFTGMRCYRTHLGLQVDWGNPIEEHRNYTDGDFTKIPISDN